MKTSTKVIIIGSVLILSVILISFNISGLDFNNSNSSQEYLHSWTKGICNETQCQDYEIYCNGDEMINKTPITGAFIMISPNWEDPRNESMRERVCD